MVKKVVMRSRFLKKTFQVRKKSLDEKPELTTTAAQQMFHRMKNEADQDAKNGNRMRKPGPSVAGYGIPNQRFLSRFLLTFGLDRIAAIPNGHRQVFALHPNAMQSEMGVDISDIITKYRAEQDLWRKSVQPILEDKEGLGKGSEQERMAAYESLGDELNKSFGGLPLELRDILFTVYCSEDGAYDLKIIGLPKGKSDHISYDVSGTSFEGAFADLDSSDFVEKPIEGFRLSDEAEDFKNFYSSEFSKIPDPRKASFMAKVSDPVKKDPLAYAYSESQAFIAQHTKHNVVAMVGDEQMNQFEPAMISFLFSPRFKDILQDFASVDEKWIRMFEFPFSQPNYPRSDLKRLISNVKANKRVGLYDRAAIAATQNRTRSSSQIESLLERFAPSDQRGNYDLDALKIIGLLSESERNAAFGETGIRYAQLNQALQRHLFECCYFNSYNKLTFIDVGHQPLSENEAGPTFLAPFGITPDARFKVVVSKRGLIQASTSLNQDLLSLSARGWGALKYQSEHPEEFEDSNLKIDSKASFRRILETTYLFELRLSTKIVWTTALKDIGLSDGASFTINNFPEDLKRDFQLGYENTKSRAKERREAQKSKSGGGGIARQNRT